VTWQCGGRSVTWQCGGRSPLPQCEQDKGDDCGLQEKEGLTHPHYIDEAAVEQVESFKFLNFHITNKLSL
jgi:hypothetical protein